LRVVKVDGDKNLLFVEGAVPGSNGGIVTVRPSIKGKKPPKVQTKVVVEDKKSAKKEKAKK